MGFRRHRTTWRNPAALWTTNYMYEDNNNIMVISHMTRLHSCKCPGIAGTVPEFMPISQLYLTQNSTYVREFYKPRAWSCHMIPSVVPRKPYRCAITSFRHYCEHKIILVLFSSCATSFCFCHTHQGYCVYMLFA